jgi:hypothetical protein
MTMGALDDIKDNADKEMKKSAIKIKAKADKKNNNPDFTNPGS